MLRVAVLMTVFNRREKTLAALEGCFRQIDSVAAQEKYSFEIWITDDGSTDGTSEAVSQAYPSVHILHSGGGLYWNRGMRLAWTEAAKDEPDFYLWLNDDTILAEGALAVMLETSEYLRHKAIVVGTATGEDGSYSYGGRMRSNKIVPPDPVIPVPCYTFNGNLVLVPKAVYDALGNLEPAYHHSFGDYDYGVRALKKNITRVVAPGVLATCDRNPGVEVWRNSGYSLRERYAYLLGPKGRPPREQFLYDTRSMGFFGAIGHFISVNLKVLFPRRTKS
ncbi:MAG: glycosyltransferase family 2 protein [Bacteroidales bacterium]|nr:glycosyltransferase family 2 protein [Bacteroidales bacterium]